MNVLDSFCIMEFNSRLRGCFKLIVMGEFSRDTLIKIVSLNIFNMKTICELTGIPYQTYRFAKSKNFECMSDERIEKLLKTIYSIVKFY